MSQHNPPPQDGGDPLADVFAPDDPQPSTDNADGAASGGDANTGDDLAAVLGVEPAPPPAQRMASPNAPAPPQQPAKPAPAPPQQPAKPAPAPPQQPAKPAPAPPQQPAKPAAPTGYLGAGAGGDSGDQHEMVAWMRQLERARRYTDAETLYPYVDQITGLFAEVQELKTFAEHLEITRDHDQYARDRARLEELVAPHMQQAGVRVPSGDDLRHVLDMVYDELVGLGPLGELWRDDEVTEIMVNAHDDVRVERDGEMVRTVVAFRDERHLWRVAVELSQRISDRPVSPANPIVTAELPRARVQFTAGDATRTGMVITMRKFRPLLGMRELLGYQSLTESMARFLSTAVQARATTLISGATNAGKTSLLNALSESIGSEERLVTIEDMFELQLDHDHVVQFQVRETGADASSGAVTLRDHLIASLRHSPSRIIVGEIREEEGCEAMLQAASTGHEGTMTTIHADSAWEALNDRLADLARGREGRRPHDVAARRIARSIDLVVQVSRGHRGRRFVSEIAVVDDQIGADGQVRVHPVFAADQRPDGSVEFQHVAGVPEDTRLAARMVRDLGVNLSDWEPERTP